MATTVGNFAGHRNLQMVGKSFAQCYYRVLNESPENVLEFYNDESILTRPDCDGAFRSITTTCAIKKYYLSTDLKSSSVQIDNIVSQTTPRGCMLTLVIGSFIMPDTVKRRFVQSFVVAPQGIGGYLVMNDLLQYVPAEPETLPAKESKDLELPFSKLYIV